MNSLVAANQLGLAVQTLYRRRNKANLLGTEQYDPKLMLVAF